MLVPHYPLRRVCFETGLSSRAVNDLPLCALAACESSPYPHVREGIYSSFQPLPDGPARVGFLSLLCAHPLLMVKLHLSLALPASPGNLPYRNVSPCVSFIK